MTMITPSYLGETIEYSSLHACRSTLEDPTLKPRGLFVSFGNASGPVPPFSIADLNNHGSLFATRPKLNDYIGKRSELLEGADTLFAAVINGKLHVPINHAYALKDAAKAHIDLESRATTGASILKP